MSLKGVLNMRLLVAKDCMMNILFANLSEWDAGEVITSTYYNNKTSDPILIISAPF